MTFIDSELCLVLISLKCQTAITDIYVMTSYSKNNIKLYTTGTKSE